MDEDYGIWTNSEGLLTIGKKWDNPQESVITTEENSKCSGFNSFWWQNWNTWWRFQSWLKSTEIDKKSHKAVASCYKHPVIFLEANKLVPLFFKKQGRITPVVPIYWAYDYEAKEFMFPNKNRKLPKYFSKLNNYDDWVKLWKISKNR